MLTPSTDYLHREIEEAAKRGLLCSQMVIDIGLRELGLGSPDLVKGAGGLVGAMGFQGVTCGALTGGALLLTFAAVDKLDRSIYLLIEDLEYRFNQLVSRCPGNRCADILDHEPEKHPHEVCYPLIGSAISIVLELLETTGITRKIAEEQELETSLLVLESQVSRK